MDTGEQEEWAEDMDEDANICESDFGSENHHDDLSDMRGLEAALMAQVIKEHSYAKTPQLETLAQPSLVVNSQQPSITVPSVSRPSHSPSRQIQEQKLFDAIPKVEADVKAGPDVIKPLQNKTSGNPNRIDLTIAVSGNKEVEDLYTSFEEEINNNEQLVSRPHPVYIDDYKRLAEGEWLNTNILDFYLQHVYNNLPAEKMRNIYVHDTTFFSVLSGVDGLNQVKNYFKTVNFFDKEIISALKTFNFINSHADHPQIIPY